MKTLITLAALLLIARQRLLPILIGSCARTAQAAGSAGSAWIPESAFALATIVSWLLNDILIKLHPTGDAENKEWMLHLSKRGVDLFSRHVWM